MFTTRLLSVVLLGLGAILTIDRLADKTSTRMDLALLGAVCLSFGSLLYALEPILVTWTLEKLKDRGKNP